MNNNGSNVFGDWLGRQITRRGWSQREFGKLANISGSQVNMVINGKKNPGWDFLEACAAPLETTPLAMFIRAGKIQAGLGGATEKYYAATMTTDEARLLEVYRQLSETDQQTIQVLAVAMRDRQRPAEVEAERETA